VTSPLSTAAFVYARLDSSRFPGKALESLGHERLIHAVYRRSTAIRADLVVVLTTDRSVDDPLVDFCRRNRFEVFRGNPFDLVRRTLDALDAYQPERFVRVNGDSPLIAPSLVNAALRWADGGPELVSNLFVRTFPYGIGIECVSSAAYRRVAPYARAVDVEHVTRHLYRPDVRRKLTAVSMRDAARTATTARVVVDTPADLDAIRNLVGDAPLADTPYWSLLGVAPPSIVFEDVP